MKIGRLAAALALLVAVTRPVTWVLGWPCTQFSVTAASPRLRHRVPQTGLVQLSSTSSSGLPAFAVAMLCSALLLTRRRKTCSSMQADEIPVRCPRTGAPMCFCQSSTRNPGLVATRRAEYPLVSSRRSSGSALKRQALCFPGTAVPVDSEGVVFPIRATVEVGEAGRSCSGEETTTGVRGMITFTQTDAENCIVNYEVENLTPGDHGFHVHEKADFSNGCASAGPHYNPFGKWHGGPDDLDRHVGDLGNITAGDDGIAKGAMTDKHIKLFGEYTIVGRSIMIHADPDDLGRGDLCGWPDIPPPAAPAQHTKTTGNAGARIGCGVINLG